MKCTQPFHSLYIQKHEYTSTYTGLYLSGERKIKEKQFEISAGNISWELRNLISPPIRVSDNYTQSQPSTARFTLKKPFRRKAIG